MDNIASFSRLLLVIGNIISWVVVVIVSILYGSGNLHYHPSYIAAIHPTRFTPADWTFSIWIVIFILTGLFVVYQALPTKRDSSLIFLSIGPLFILHHVFLFIWLFCLTYDSLWAALVFILGAFISMILIYIRVGVSYSAQGRIRTDLEGNPVSTLDFWLLQLPFSVTLGWLTVDFITNFVLALSTKSYHLGWSATGWSVLLQILVSIVAFIILRTRHDPFYAAPIAWALLGIADRYRGDDTVVTSALVAATLVGIAAIVTFVHVLFHFFYRHRYANIHN